MAHCYYIARLGIQRSDHVLLYDTHGVFSSPRALFTFRAFGHERSSVINGGLHACEASGFPIEQGARKKEPEVPLATYPVVKSDLTRIRDYNQVVLNSAMSPSMSSDVELVLDARSRGRWAGIDPEPRPGMRSGHIPHSISVPSNTLLEEKPISGTEIKYTTILEANELKEELIKALGEEYFQEVLSGKRSVINSCGSGMSAAIIWLALRILGVESAIYDESWSGYAVRGESRIDTVVTS